MASSRSAVAKVLPAIAVVFTAIVKLFVGLSFYQREITSLNTMMLSMESHH